MSCYFNNNAPHVFSRTWSNCHKFHCRTNTNSQTLSYTCMYNWYRHAFSEYKRRTQPWYPGALLTVGLVLLHSIDKSFCVEEKGTVDLNAQTQEQTVTRREKPKLPCQAVRLLREFTRGRKADFNVWTLVSLERAHSFIQPYLCELTCSTGL